MQTAKTDPTGRMPRLIRDFAWENSSILLVWSRSGQFPNTLPAISWFDSLSRAVWNERKNVRFVFGSVSRFSYFNVVPLQKDIGFIVLPNNKSFKLFVYICKCNIYIRTIISVQNLIFIWFGDCYQNRLVYTVFKLFNKFPACETATITCILRRSSLNHGISLYFKVLVNFSESGLP